MGKGRYGEHDSRAGVAPKFALEIDGTDAGWIHSCEGGTAESEVVQSKIAASKLVQKSIGNVKYTDIKVQCGAGMSKGFWEWIDASLKLKYARKNGAVVACDPNNNEVSRLNFFHALITEIGFPALDAASKDAAKVSLAFAPETTRNVWKTGGAPKGSFKRDAQMNWSPANFKIQAEGLNDSLGKCNKIEALTLKQKVVEDAQGDARDYFKVPTTIEVPNLVVTVAESHCDEFYAWHEEFVIKGNCGHDKEKTFSIQYLDQTRTKVLLELNLLRCGIFKLTPDKVEAGSEQIRRVKCEMYCEEIELKAQQFWG